MCTGGRLIADFVAGTDARPGLAEDLEQHLTTTADGLWVIWAYKLARQEGDLFVPLTGGPGYPADAKATCKVRGTRRGHHAPDPRCTCGFHALSIRSLPGLLPRGYSVPVLNVALSGRVLAFEWHGGGVLWRAERQTVIRIERPPPIDPTWAALDRRQAVLALSNRRGPGDPDGRPAVVHHAAPRDSGPIRLSLPVSAPVVPVHHDDAGWCVRSPTVERAPAALVPA